MGKRGPKSAYELTVRPNPIGLPRLNPPASLSNAERRIWVATVNSMPGGHFSEAQVPLLVALCRRVAKADVLAAMILDFREEWLKIEGGLERMDKLYAMADREDRGITALARSLRLTLQAQRTAGNAGTIHRTTPALGVPWDDDPCPDER